jgi:hypothetical protein
MTGTMLNILRARAGRISEEGIRLLKDFSGMHPANTSYDSVVFISPSGNHFWNDLPLEGKKIQTRLLPEIDQFTELVCTVARNLPRASQKDLRDVLKAIRSAVEQNGTTWWKTKDEAVDGFRKSIDEVLTTLADYYGTSSKAALAIPDTNALLGNPDVEHWRFEGAGHFTIILTPTVLSEIDVLKIGHKSQDVRDKAVKLIRKFKEYRRRGSLIEGISVVKDSVSLRAIALEPDMSQTLPWLEATNADDRFLATALEVIRKNLGVRVFIVTSDINMQNKAEMAGIPSREVPAQRAGQGEE